MLDTVERDRPVRRATSARLATPSIRSASITRSRFDSRTEPRTRAALLSSGEDPYPLRGLSRLGPKETVKRACLFLRPAEGRAQRAE